VCTLKVSQDFRTSWTAVAMETIPTMLVLSERIISFAGKIPELENTQCSLGQGFTV